MRIAVTGASGFIGTELLAKLIEKEHALTRGGSALDSPYCDAENIEWRETDYSVGSLTDSLQGTDAVVHLAGARGTSSDPADYLVNEELTRNLLRAMKEAGTGRIIFASTISVYDDTDLIPWTEDAPLQGRTAYGESKIKCETLIRSIAEEYGYTYAVIRIAQVLGAGERRRGMMNVFLDTAKERGTLKVIGKSTAKRQYIYVEDLAGIIIRLRWRIT